MMVIAGEIPQPAEEGTIYLSDLLVQLHLHVDGRRKPHPTLLDKPIFPPPPSPSPMTPIRQKGPTYPKFGPRAARRVREPLLRERGRREGTIATPATGSLVCRLHESRIIAPSTLSLPFRLHSAPLPAGVGGGGRYTVLHSLHLRIRCPVLLFAYALLHSVVLSDSITELPSAQASCQLVPSTSPANRPRQTMDSPRLLYMCRHQLSICFAGLSVLSVCVYHVSNPFYCSLSVPLLREPLYCMSS
ncbi:hypothetical protein LY78DRAFT_281223 [Colletotrichum sublineola]|nr:hypothetical protein LY78DRAFT_281223 [Colletotrichum sublineola]